ncbi:unnamed protein product [Caenorhabditis auriculariae]|uniref:Reelin domain-containing protein n=1 Tax=Caenorhabditis auriculariae TaxID=2777116 RepID=A0A8S1HP81_9PELO|nr:unnamed protein product [Caenorhabditis auriculariae]
MSPLGSLLSCLLAMTSLGRVGAWPDGAPCIHSAMESMNPLEAIEHQGGLQLTVPPYEIAVDQKCYWRNQPIGLTIQGLNESVWFKGFNIQPHQWDNDRLGPRIGQLVRLDDNGSWQQQCFRFKDSATHSHDEKKKHIKMWWKVDDEVDTVQFVATVVKHQTMFWVRSVRSKPLPPCRLNRDGFPSYVAPLPTVPPPTKQFKMDTVSMFESGRPAAPRIVQPPPAFIDRPTAPPPPPQVIPTTTRFVPSQNNFRQGFTRGFTSAPPVQTQPFTQAIPPRPTGVISNEVAFSVAPRRRVSQFVRGRSGFTRRPCVDADTAGRCGQMLQLCRLRLHINWMFANCALSCGFCRPRP